MYVQKTLGDRKAKTYHSYRDSKVREASFFQTSLPPPHQGTTAFSSKCAQRKAVATTHHSQCQDCAKLNNLIPFITQPQHPCNVTAHTPSTTCIWWRRFSQRREREQTKTRDPPPLRIKSTTAFRIFLVLSTAANSAQGIGRRRSYAYILIVIS